MSGHRSRACTTPAFAGMVGGVSSGESCKGKEPAKLVDFAPFLRFPLIVAAGGE